MTVHEAEVLKVVFLAGKLSSMYSACMYIFTYRCFFRNRVEMRMEIGFFPVCFSAQLWHASYSIKYEYYLFKEGYSSRCAFEKLTLAFCCKRPASVAVVDTS